MLKIAMVRLGMNAYFQYFGETMSFIKPVKDWSSKKNKKIVNTTSTAIMQMNQKI